jgi:hypothetical protein
VVATVGLAAAVGGGRFDDGQHISLKIVVKRYQIDP